MPLCWALDMGSTDTESQASFGTGIIQHGCFYDISVTKPHIIRKMCKENKETKSPIIINVNWNVTIAVTN